MVTILSSWCSCCPDGPGRAGTEDPEHREAGQVDRGREQREVGSDLGSATHPGAAATMVTTHEMGDATLHLRSGGAVVGLPSGILARLAGPGEAGLVGSHPDAASGLRRGATGDQWTRRTSCPEGSHRAMMAGAQRSGHSRRAGDRGGLGVDAELVLGTLMRNSAPAVSRCSSSSPLP